MREHLIFLLKESIVTGINAIGNGDIEAVVDGTFLPDLPSHLITSGRFSTVEYMGGHCTHDGMLRTFPFDSLNSGTSMGIVPRSDFCWR